VRALGGGWTTKDLPGPDQMITLDPWKEGFANPYKQQ